ncbi:hypothetical protein JAAARDRAFT_441449 [Jaapia argillacea MUCL 33604]|uniref:Uncharacterized protein n=1 Tax=Jaapia argillacea MUCL 33604 TaxID=933084 RepID=A0A067PNW5_9AGAM|nr:hypothetical protein JAAARDRAFT_441449 [Jaapia argillacea MUCL 33604]
MLHRVLTNLNLYSHIPNMLKSLKKFSSDNISYPISVGSMKAASPGVQEKDPGLGAKECAKSPTAMENTENPHPNGSNVSTIAFPVIAGTHSLTGQPSGRQTGTTPDDATISLNGAVINLYPLPCSRYRSTDHPLGTRSTSSPIPVGNAAGTSLWAQENLAVKVPDNQEYLASATNTENQHAGVVDSSVTAAIPSPTDQPSGTGTSPDGEPARVLDNEESPASVTDGAGVDNVPSPQDSAERYTTAQDSSPALPYIKNSEFATTAISSSPPTIPRRSPLRPAPRPRAASLNPPPDQQPITQMRLLHAKSFGTLSGFLSSITQQTHLVDVLEPLPLPPDPAPDLTLPLSPSVENQHTWAVDPSITPGMPSPIDQPSGTSTSPDGAQLPLPGAAINWKTPPCSDYRTTGHSLRIHSRSSPFPVGNTTDDSLGTGEKPAEVLDNKECPSLATSTETSAIDSSVVAETPSSTDQPTEQVI